MIDRLKIRDCKHSKIIVKKNTTENCILKYNIFLYLEILVMSSLFMKVNF